MSRDFLKRIFTLLVFLSSPALAQLSVSPNGRHLINPDGSPFLWLGDTGWGLFQKITREEVELYLKKRSEQGFTVIHAAAIHKNPFITPELENSNGAKAFTDEPNMIPKITEGNDPANATEYDYWDHVEYVIDKAKDYHIQLVFLPLFNMVDGEGYNLINPSNAFAYGKFLGERFGEKENIIWCIGGDVLADNDHKKETWNQLAKGINEGVAGNEDYSKTLMTFHTRGGHTSSEYFKNAPWIDFHMLQTWDSYTKIFEVVSRDYRSQPTKPILHGEGAYEDGPEYPTKPITPFKIRKQAYWATFAGGLHTYGNSNVWSFGSNPKYVTDDWKVALESQGAQQMSVYQDILNSLVWWEFVPDQSVILEGKGAGDSLNVAMVSKTTGQLLVYLSSPESKLTLDATGVSEEKKLYGLWIDPRTGQRMKAGKFKTQKTIQIETPEGFEDVLFLLGENDPLLN